MRKSKVSIWQRLTFFLVAIIILGIVAYTGYGVATEKSSYMRFGIDIKGGVSATFQSSDDSIVPTDEQLESAKSVIELRLDSNNILDRTVSIDKENHNILVEFPWQASEKNFDPVAAIAELGETAQLTFAVVEPVEAKGKDTYTVEYEGGYSANYTIKETFMDGSHVTDATAGYLEGKYVVQLEFDKEGADTFGDVTAANVGGMIGILMDNTMISAASVTEAIPGEYGCYIEGNFDSETAKDLAAKISSGSLPFDMKTTNYSSVSATMGTQALSVMILAGIIALCIIVLFMCIYYRLPGFTASLTLLLQTAGQLLIFHLMGLTLTLPGIAGIILSIGMGVDSNIIIAERIKEEINNGKTLRGAISAGYNRAFSAVLDCNVTTAVVGILLMIFGTGSMLSFAYTLLIGIVLNFGLSIISTKWMLQSLSSYNIFSNPKFYGYKSKKEVA